MNTKSLGRPYENWKDSDYLAGLYPMTFIGDEWVEVPASFIPKYTNDRGWVWRTPVHELRGYRVRGSLHNEYGSVITVVRVVDRNRAAPRMMGEYLTSKQIK